MDFLGKLVSGGRVLLNVAASTLFKSSLETKRRKGSPLLFDQALSQSDFTQMAQDIAKRAPRVADVIVTGMTVTLRVASNTGLSTWTAEIDFNDYGRLTGKHWLHAENSQSLIPKHFAMAMQAQIERRANRAASEL